MTTKRAAIVDVDGTVVDSNHLHVVTWWEAFRQAGRHAPMREIHRTVGLGSGNLIEHLLGDDRGPDGDDPLAATHHALYATYFERLPAPDDAGDLLRALARRGWKIVLATSASGAELSALRGAIDADDVILGAASADDVDDGKAAPNPARQAGELAGVPSERAVFGGDTVWDMKAAVRDGVVPVAVLPGGIPRADLEAAGARALYRDPGGLRRHLDGRRLRRLRVSRGDHSPEPLTERSVWSYKVALRLATASWRRGPGRGLFRPRSAGAMRKWPRPRHSRTTAPIPGAPELIRDARGCSRASLELWAMGYGIWRCGSSASRARRCRFSSFAATPTTQAS